LNSCNFRRYNIQKKKIRSSSLDRSPLEDSIEVYFVFFGVVFHFLGILEYYNSFWNYKRKRKNSKTRAHSAGPHCGTRHWPVGPAQLGKRPAARQWGAHAGRAHGAMACLPMARCGRRALVGPHGGVGQGGGRWGSPKRMCRGEAGRGLVVAAVPVGGGTPVMSCNKERPRRR
jgi:hypothetical protein